MSESNVGASPARWGSGAVDTSAWNLPALKVSYLLRHLPARGRLLEVGSGEGRVLKTVARYCPELELFGCDVEPPRSATPAYHFRTMGERIPFDDEQFDAVLVVDSLEHVLDPARLLSEVRRVIAPSGVFTGFVPVEGERWSAYTLFRKLFGPELYVETKHHIQAFTHSGLRELLERQFHTVDWSFAYHGLGQFMDAGFFALSRWRPVNRYWWTENSYYHPRVGSRSWVSRALEPALALGSALAYAESRALQDVRLGAAGVLFTARPR